MVSQVIRLSYFVDASLQLRVPRASGQFPLIQDFLVLIDITVVLAWLESRLSPRMAR